MRAVTSTSGARRAKPAWSPWPMCSQECVAINHNLDPMTGLLVLRQHGTTHWHVAFSYPDEHILINSIGADVQSSCCRVLKNVPARSGSARARSMVGNKSINIVKAEVVNLSRFRTDRRQRYCCRLVAGGLGPGWSPSKQWDKSAALNRK